MNNFSLLFLLTIIFFACSPNEEANPPVALQEQTPEALNENDDFAKVSFSRSYRVDIIEKLFQEAKEKDPKLKALTERVEGFDDEIDDRLKEYNTYFTNNEQYWNTVDQYLEELSDTVLRNEMKEIFLRHEINFQQQIKTHKGLALQINKREQQLADRQVVMKLLVTAPMMINYQHNERPATEPLEFVKNKYDTLIKEVKTFSKANNKSGQATAGQ